MLKGGCTSWYGYIQSRLVESERRSSFGRWINTISHGKRRQSCRLLPYFLGRVMTGIFPRSTDMLLVNGRKVRVGRVSGRHSIKGNRREKAVPWEFNK